MSIYLNANDRGRQDVVRHAQSMLAELPTDKTYRVDVEECTDTRTARQNRYLWGVAYAAFMAKLPGWDKEDVHEYLLGEWSGWIDVSGMGIAKSKPLKRSKNLSKKAFAEYTDFIIRRGIKHGILIPQPDPYHSMPQERFAADAA